GLDARRRGAVEGLLRERLSGEGLAPEQAAALSLILAALGDAGPQSAREAAVALTRAMTQTKDPGALGQLAGGLGAVAARLEPRGAQEAAAALTQAMTETTDFSKLYSLAGGLRAVAARLDAKGAKAATAALTRAMTQTTDGSKLYHLAEVLRAVAA